MTQRIVFFTAGGLPTTDELAAIETLNAAAERPYEVIVANAAANATYGDPDRAIPTDFVAGDNIPAIYSEVDVIDPDDMPTGLAETQAIVEDGAVIDTVDGGTVTFAVSGGEITSATYVSG